MEARLIPLTQGKVAIVDPQDFRRVIKHKWCVLKKAGRKAIYAQSNMKIGGRWTRVMLHRFILAPADGLQVDHKDGDGLNCCRENLRLATHSENMRNSRSRKGTSKFKGVHWHRKAEKWTSQIGAGSDYRYLGLFVHEEDAARAYDKAAKELHGEFARLNFQG